MENKMNRRNLLQSFSVLPFFGNRKIRLDRIKKVTAIGKRKQIENQQWLYSFQIEPVDMFVDPLTIKDTLKMIQYDQYEEVILEDGNKNVLKVNKLNKGLVLLKLDMIK